MNSLELTIPGHGYACNSDTTLIDFECNEKEPYRETVIAFYAQYGIVALDARCGFYYKKSDLKKPSFPSQGYIFARRKDVIVTFATESDLTAARLLL